MPVFLSQYRTIKTPGGLVTISFTFTFTFTFEFKFTFTYSVVINYTVDNYNHSYYTIITVSDVYV